MVKEAASPMQSTVTSSKRPRWTNDQRMMIMGYALVAPIVICLLILVVYPFFFAIYISFTDRMIGQPGNFVGFG